MEYPSFDQFAEVVRRYAELKRDTCINPQTQLQRDLGMNPKRCSAFLKTLEMHYGITLSPDSFDLKADERLFDLKEADEEPFMQTVFGTSRTEVRPLSLGHLCRAVLKELNRQRNAGPMLIHRS
jgi:hypothetical protein